MGQRPRTLIVCLALWASLAVVAAQDPRGTQRFTFGPSTAEACANADCQQGTCVPNNNALVSLLFPYKCQCNPGWATLQKIVSVVEIPSLPCNVPNCTLNVDCAGSSPSAAPSPSTPIISANISACLVPNICGHGTCEATLSDTNVPSFKCLCDAGYANVGSLSGGYCVSDCELNGGCQNLNLTAPGVNSPLSPGAMSPSTTNSGCTGVPLSSGFYITGALALGWSFFSTLC